MLKQGTAWADDTHDCDLDVFARRESDVRGYCRHFPVLFTRAEGSWVEDADGRRYVDFLAGCGALNYGHNHPAMARALVDYIGSNGIAAGLDLHTPAKRDFLLAFERIVLQPRGLDHRVQFTGPTGANAVEAAMKLARKVTGRTNIVAFTNGYHGVTLGALAATGNRGNRMGVQAPQGGVTRMPYDGYAGEGVDTAALLDKMLGDPSSGVHDPAAIILETVQGEGGLNAASPAWLRRIAEIAARHGALLIVDDIQAGCGRTGTFFSFEPAGIVPDIVTLSKSISGFGLPMSLVLVKPEHDQWRPAEHNGTFRGNSHAFVTARAALETFWADGSGFEARIAAAAVTVGRRLGELAALVPGSRLKGRGMMQGLDTGSGALSGAACRLAFERGLIVETSGPFGEVIKILAPVTTPESELETGFDILKAALQDALPAVASAA